MKYHAVSIWLFLLDIYNCDMSAPTATLEAKVMQTSCNAAPPKEETPSVHL